MTTLCFYGGLANSSTLLALSLSSVLSAVFVLPVCGDMDVQPEVSPGVISTLVSHLTESHGFHFLAMLLVLFRGGAALLQGLCARSNTGGDRTPCSHAHIPRNY